MSARGSSLRQQFRDVGWSGGRNQRRAGAVDGREIAAREHLWAVAHALYPDDETFARQWVEPMLQQLRCGRAPALPGDLRTLVKRLRHKKRQAIAAELAYLASHQHRMDYPAARRRGEPEGSGAMESTGRSYQCRFKRTGQFWSRAGDETLMGLETFWRNDGWHLLFPHIRHQDPP